LSAGSTPTKSPNKIIGVHHSSLDERTSAWKSSSSKLKLAVGQNSPAAELKNCDLLLQGFCLTVNDSAVLQVIFFSQSY